MGSTTYEWILDHAKGWPYADVRSWVFSSRELRQAPGADIRFVRGEVAPVTLGAGRPLLPARVELRLEETGRNGDFVSARYSVVRER